MPFPVSLVLDEQSHDDDKLQYRLGGRCCIRASGQKKTRRGRPVLATGRKAGNVNAQYALGKVLAGYGELVEMCNRPAATAWLEKAGRCGKYFRSVCTGETLSGKAAWEKRMQKKQGELFQKAAEKGKGLRCTDLAGCIWVKERTYPKI